MVDCQRCRSVIRLVDPIRGYYQCKCHHGDIYQKCQECSYLVQDHDGTWINGVECQSCRNIWCYPHFIMSTDGGEEEEELEEVDQDDWICKKCQNSFVIKHEKDQPAKPTDTFTRSLFKTKKYEKDESSDDEEEDQQRKQRKQIDTTQMQNAEHDAERNTEKVYLDIIKLILWDPFSDIRDVVVVNGPD